jgi:hypothetical protein
MKPWLAGSPGLPRAANPPLPKTQDPGSDSYPAPSHCLPAQQHCRTCDPTALHSQVKGVGKAFHEVFYLMDCHRELRGDVYGFARHMKILTYAHVQAYAHAVTPADT